MPVCYLVKIMPNLRLLYVKCDDKKQRKQSSTYDHRSKRNLTQDEFINWLQHQLLSLRSLFKIFGCFSMIILRLS